ncbi:MAG: MBL fold metallo-hydrolase [Candidatus Anstonellales archaeon]
MIPKVRFIPLGGSGEVGANSYYINWCDKVKILLDCGTKGDGPVYDGLPDFTKMDDKVDYIIITHAHNDHIGGLPFFEKNFLKEGGKIIMTSKTSDIAKLVLNDIGKIMRRKEEKSHVDIFSKGLKKLYSNENIQGILSKDKVIELDYDSEYLICDDVKVRLYDASHVYGSACVYIYDGRHSLFYTGDFNDSPTNIHDGIRLPDAVESDILIMETTNASKGSRHLKLEDKINQLEYYINKVVRNRGRILIPAFALGRTQEILLSIEKLKESNKIDRDIKVYISGGLSKKISEYYFKDNKKPDYKILREGEIPSVGSIAVVTSGFFTKDSIAGQIACVIKEDKNSLILFPSEYAYKEVIESGRSNNWFYDYRCGVEYIDFSAHASFDGIRYLVDKLKPKHTILVHGSLESSNFVSNNMRHKTNFIIPYLNGEEHIFYLLDDGLEHHSSITDRSYIITVGTSLKDRNITNDEEAKKYSAELNTLLNIPSLDLTNSICHLVCTEESNIQAEKIANYLEVMKGVPCCIHKVKVDLREDIISQSMEMSDIISKLSTLLLRCKDGIVVFTGGFKFEVAVSYLLSNLYGVKAYYKHESQSITESSLSLQSIPISLDITPYYGYFPEIVSILNSDYEVAEKILRRLPRNIRNIFAFEGESIRLNNFGSIIYGKLKKVYRDNEREYMGFIKDKVIITEFFTEIWNFEDSKDKLSFFMIGSISNGFNRFLTNLVRSPYVKTIIFGRVVSEGCNYEELRLKFERILSGNKILFKIYYLNKSQTLTLHILKDSISELKRVIGLSRGESLVFEVSKF